VTLLDPPAKPALFEQACVCWIFLPSSPPAIEYELVLYAADGAGGDPGTELARVAASADRVVGASTFFTHDLAALQLDVPTEPFYLGVATDWDSSDGFLCDDRGGAADARVRASPDDGVTWSELPSDIRAVGVRADIKVLGSCVPGPNRLCIDDEPGDRRFAITGSYETVLGGGAKGAARATALAPLGIREGGILSFFSATNPEILVKVLNGCAINEHFWVFFAATTTVGFELVVEDTVAQTERRYSNPDLHAAAPITDTAGLPCP
jgi:hypothetical protein